MPATPGYFLGLSAVGLLCVATCRAQITQRVDVRISAANWDTLAAATGKRKEDGNDLSLIHI